MFPPKSMKDKRKLLVAQRTQLMVVWDKPLFCDCLMSPKGPIQPTPRLTSRQLWFTSSDFVVYLDGKGKVKAPSNLYKIVFNYVFSQECSIELASEFFS